MMKKPDFSAQRELATRAKVTANGVAVGGVTANGVAVGSVTPNGVASASVTPNGVATDAPCTRCGGREYLVTRGEELAEAVVCECRATCAKCKGARYVIAREGVYDVAVPCDCAALHRRVRAFNDARIPAGYADKRLTPSGPNDLHGFSDRKSESLKRAKAAVHRYRISVDASQAQGLLLIGGFGVGKTHLVCGLVSYLTLERGIGCRFVDYHELMARIRATFDRKDETENEAAIIEPLVQVPVLVIDDLGKGQGSNWELTILDQIITRRYNARRIILATTNYRPESEGGGESDKRRGLESLEERIGGRLVSRLQASCEFMVLDVDDYRKTGPKAAR